MLKTVKAAASGILALCAAAGFTSAPAAAGGGCCDCYGGYGARAYGYAPVPRAYVYQPGVAYYDVGPRGYAASYYAPPPPPPAYGYVYVDRGPAVVIERRPRFYRRW